MYDQTAVNSLEQSPLHTVIDMPVDINISEFLVTKIKNNPDFSLLKAIIRDQGAMIGQNQKATQWFANGPKGVADTILIVAISLTVVTIEVNVVAYMIWKYTKKKEVDIAKTVLGQDSSEDEDYEVPTCTGDIPLQEFTKENSYEEPRSRAQSPISHKSTKSEHSVRTMFSHKGILKRARSRWGIDSSESDEQ